MKQSTYTRLRPWLWALTLAVVTTSILVQVFR
jgi:hypothetical protein